MTSAIEMRLIQIKKGQDSTEYTFALQRKADNTTSRDNSMNISLLFWSTVTASTLLTLRAEAKEKADGYRFL